jgi:hypothetical protein
MTVSLPQKCSFEQLGMNVQFVKQAEKMGMYNLEDILKIDLEKLKQHQAFTFTWYADMLTLLKDHDLIRQFQENQL